ncbi:hypothetical protein FB451DRAFT_1173495 [Mycena latifolia]|nr:hypothetical protein FB451DRAFT_1173495 [Mycena latifolia]
MFSSTEQEVRQETSNSNGEISEGTSTETRDEEAAGTVERKGREAELPTPRVFAPLKRDTLRERVLTTLTERGMTGLLRARAPSRMMPWAERDRVSEAPKILSIHDAEKEERIRTWRARGPTGAIVAKYSNTDGARDRWTLEHEGIRQRKVTVGRDMKGNDSPDRLGVTGSTSGEDAKNANVLKLEGMRSPEYNRESRTQAAQSSPRMTSGAAGVGATTAQTRVKEKGSRPPAETVKRRQRRISEGQRRHGKALDKQRHEGQREGRWSKQRMGGVYITRGRCKGVHQGMMDIQESGKYNLVEDEATDSEEAAPEAGMQPVWVTYRVVSNIFICIDGDSPGDEGTFNRDSMGDLRTCRRWRAFIILNVDACNAESAEAAAGGLVESRELGDEVGCDIPRQGVGAE